MSLPAARDDYTVRNSVGSYRVRLYLNASTTGGEQSLFIVIGTLCRLFVITSNVVLITLKVSILR